MARSRKNQIKIYLSDEELEKLNKKLEQAHITNQSEYVRKVILDKKIIVIDDFKEILTEFRHAGNNLNQLTKAVNSGMITDTSKEISDLKKSYSTVFEEILKTLKKV